MNKLCYLFFIVMLISGCAAANNFKTEYLKAYRAGMNESVKQDRSQEQNKKQSIKGIPWQQAKTSSVGNEGNFWNGFMGLGWNSLIFTGNVISSAIPEEQPVSNVVIGGRGPGYSCPAGYYSAPDGCHLCQGNGWPSINTNNHPVQR